MAVRIHPTAIVEEGAHLEEGTEIGPYAVIHSGARIGPGCWVGPHVVVYGGTHVGARCRIHAGAVIGDLPQDLSFQSGESGVEIGPDCVIREGVTIHRGTKPGTITFIGPRCYLMAFSHVGHNARLGERVIMANGALIAGHVVVEDYVFISGNCLIHQFCRVGRLSMLGGGAALNKDCPPYCLVRPVALNRVVGLNVVGMRRAGLDAAARSSIRRAFKVLYCSGLTVSEALERLRQEFPTGPAAEFARFIAESKRGLCPGPRSEAELESEED